MTRFHVALHLAVPLTGIEGLVPSTELGPLLRGQLLDCGLDGLNGGHLTTLRRFAGNRLPLANRSAMGACMNRLGALPQSSIESWRHWFGPPYIPSAQLQGVVRDSNPETSRPQSQSLLERLVFKEGSHF